MRKTVTRLVVAAMLALSGCKLADRLLRAKAEPVTPGAPPAESPAQKTVEAAVKSGAIDSSTGEIILGGLLLLQNGYLLVRKVQAKGSPTA